MTESQIQAAIVQALQAMGVMFFSVPNEGHGGNTRRAMHMKSLGQMNGVSDLVVVLTSRVIFLEVKTAKGRQSKSQKDFEQRVTMRGHEYHVVRSVDDVIGVLDKTGRVR